MAKPVNNYIVRGLSGSTGNLLVVRQRQDQVVVAHAPRPRSVPPTEGELRSRARFKEATRYAKSVTADPVARLFYEPFLVYGQSVYQLALKDYLRLPEVKSVNLTKYRPDSPSAILIRLQKPFPVKHVFVEILDEAGGVLEAGSAEELFNRVEWKYNTRAGSIKGEPSAIRVLIGDIPGNRVEFTSALR